MNSEEIEMRIGQLKWELKKTDYKTLKHAEGQLSEEEWQASNAYRQAIRVEIEQLERELDGQT